MNVLSKNEFTVQNMLFSPQNDHFKRLRSKNEMPSSPLGTYHKSIFNVFTVTSEYGEVISIESGSSESQKRGYISVL